MGRVLVFCGPHNSGKTTLIRRVVPLLVQSGLSVSLVKLTKHRGIFEDEGKDTTFFLRLPSEEVVLVSPDKTAFLVKEPLSLEDVVDRLSADVVICEGFRQSPYRKIAVYRAFDADYWSEVEGVVAAVTPSKAPNPWGVPQFSPGNVEEIAKFILEKV